MRRASAISFSVLLAACGRIEFAPVPSADSAVDVSVDAERISNLIARYPFDEPSFAGHLACTNPTFDGTCATCPSSTVGKFGGAGRFDAAAYIELPASLLGATPYTVSVWAISENTANRSSFVSQALSTIGNDNTYFLWLDLNTNKGVYETFDGGFSGIASNVVTTPGWHHYATTWDGTTKRVYLDGALDATMTTTIITSTMPIEIGGDLDDNVIVSPLIGAIDELRFYDRALDDSEIAQLATP